MLDKIISFSIKNKLIIGLFTLGMIIYGALQLSKLPIDAVPDITNNQVQIITTAPSFGATDIERLITFPIEQANNNIPGLTEIRSFSRFGLSLVTIVFNDATDIYWARQQVAERLQNVQARIPAGVGIPELGPVTTGLGEIYQYVVRPKEGFEKKFNTTELRTIQDWIVRRQLLGVKGVAEVSSFGGTLKQYEIGVDPNKLKSFNLTITDVFVALEKNNQNTGGAYIEKGPVVLYIRSEGLVGSLEDIKNIRVKNLDNGTPLLIKDIAEVNYGAATRYGAMCFNDKGEVAGAIVMMLKGANSSDVIKRVKERIEQIQKTLPEGVILEPFLDRTKMVNNAIGTVEQNLMEGALIVIFVLVLFLGNVRAGLLVASVIPLAMLFAIIMMNMFGVSGNLMSLGALDFGLIVDGAVIIVEAVMHRLHHNKTTAFAQLNQQQMDKEVNQSASKMMNSAVFGQIIILVVYLPIFTLEGIEGKMFKPMAQTVAFALLGAFILSLTYIPMMSALFLSKKVNPGENFSDRLMNRLGSGYQNTLIKILNIPKTLLASTLALFAIAIIVLTYLGGEFIPTLEEGDFAVETRVLPGSNLNTTIANTQKAAKILQQKFPEIQKIVTKIGSGEVPTDPMPMDAADMMIILKDKKEWTSAKTFNELAEKMSEALVVLPGVTFSFQFPVQMRFNELMTGAKQDVVCKIYGEDLDTLARYAKKMGEIIGTVEGAKDLYVEAVTGMPQIVVNYNRAAIAQYGLSIDDINKTINASFAGQSAGLVFESEKRFDLVVRLQNNKRTNMEDVRNLLIPTPMGTQIPLQQLASVEIKDGPNQVQREDAKRRITVGFNVRGRDIQSVVNELQDKIAAEIKFPVGYYPTYGGAFENLNAAKKRLMVAVPVSLLLIFLLLYFAFNSIKHGLLIYSASPLSAIGGIFALALRGMPFSISAGVGFIALFGVAVLNGIVLIAEFNRLKKEGLSDLKQIVQQGTRLRLRPVLMTAFVASLGFFPMAVSNGSGAEVQRPLATVVIGGLLIATFLTLYVLPVLYILFEKQKKSKGINPTAISVLLVFLSPTIFSQKPVSLNLAIDSALKNNLMVRNEKLLLEYKQKLIQSSANIPLTTVSGEYGQINSAYKDNRFSVGQSFSFPTVYARQKQLLNQEWKSGQLSVNLKEAEIKRNVSMEFSNNVYLQQKKQLLLKSDSLFADFLKRSEERFKLGESNLVEKTSVEVQRMQIALQLNQLEADIEISTLKFNLLLNCKQLFVPDKNEAKIPAATINETPTVKDHPAGRLILQQKESATMASRLEKARLLPEISLLYNNMSMLGTGSDNVLYTTRSTRFQSAQLSVGIPLFFGSQKAKIASLKSMEQIAANNYEITINNLTTEYYATLFQYKNQRGNLQLYENKLLKGADDIAGAASKQFANGEINYLEWVMLMNQSIGLQNDYINTLKNLNENATLLNYLSTK
ncbi:MAG: CusA/CzcA family heavy metal efflux RND transporter [Bacteroidia bacterium]|nr:CusA/CzcA family heavy metal efflux RND transporter [Bacteroidia bacterium]